MSEVTIEITQFCENNCDYCSSNASVDGHHLTVEQIAQFIEELSSCPSRINISGGEPLANPDFYKILRLCENVCPEVWVYTNALKRIIYNADVIGEIEVHANVVLIQGRTSYIPKCRTHILKLIHQGKSIDFPEQNITVSRNFWNEEACNTCNHILLQADGQVVKAPCKKQYD